MLRGYCTSPSSAALRTPSRCCSRHFVSTMFHRLGRWTTDTVDTSSTVVGIPVDPNAPLLRDAVGDPDNTDTTPETCARACALYGNHLIATWARSYCSYRYIRDLSIYQYALKYLDHRRGNRFSVRGVQCSLSSPEGATIKATTMTENIIRFRTLIWTWKWSNIPVQSGTSYNPRRVCYSDVVG